MGYARFEDMNNAGRKIRNFRDWKLTMLGLAETALAEDRLMNAAFYFRAAEFFTKAKDPDKEALYDKFIELFYKTFEKHKLERHRVPYDGAFLPALRIPSAHESKGTILMHGGFDSLIEEWYSIMRYLSDHGYDVIGFEGPGQGAALRKHGLPLTHEWEKPTKAVLDHFHPARAALIGMSMGGWFCLRAAAFEPRVSHVIASGHSIDYMKNMNFVFRHLHMWSIRHFRDFVERMAAKKFQGEGMATWMVEHLMYITKKTKPLDALDIYMLMNERNMHPELVRQDVLVLAGREDHFIPFKMFKKQIRTLTNARSVTGRVFTKKENAQNHCQTGNVGLAVDVVIRWLDEKFAR